ncbi:MAG: hypothetical protein WCL16_06705 [bacterium]
MNIKSVRACSVRPSFAGLLVLSALAAALLVTPFSAYARRARPERPEWIAQPKSSDMMYLYVVGHAAGQPSETDAQDAAYQNALQRIAVQIDMPDGQPLQPSKIRRTEVVPGCRYVEEASSKYEAWVQVSWPTSEKQRLTSPAQKDARFPAPVTSDAVATTDSSPDVSSSGNDKGTEVGANGGVVENSKAGIIMTIPPGALKESVTITIVPQAQHPPIFDEPLPAELADAIRIGPGVDMGPSGTQFQVPIEVQWRLPDDVLPWLGKGGGVEVGYYDGEIWQPFQNVRATADGNVRFETAHFTPAVWIAYGVSSLIVGTAGSIGAYKTQTYVHPEKWIKADSPAIIDYAKNKVKLPDVQTLSQSKHVSLGLNRRFKAYIPYVFLGDGEKMLTQVEACCQEVTFFAASILRASGDPRFQNFICVQGHATLPGGDPRGDGHMWIEIEIDGKLWVVDTAAGGDIKLMLKDSAYQYYKLDPGRQFTDKSKPKKYVGLAIAGKDTIPTKWTFSGESPANWVVSYIEKGIVMKRNPATNKVASVNADLSANYPAVAAGKDDPKTSGDCLAEAEKAFKSRRPGKTPNDMASGIEMAGGVEGAKSFQIGDFQGAMVDYAIWMKHGSGSPDSGYRGSYFGSSGDGSSVKENLLIRFGYNVSGAGCWDNSDRAYLISQGEAAQKEARAILASLRVVPGTNGAIEKAPYLGPKYDGSDLAK